MPRDVLCRQRAPYGSPISIKADERPEQISSRPGLDERVQRLIQHDDSQSDAEAIAEDEAAFDDPSHTVMTIPNELVPAVRAILADHTA